MIHKHLEPLELRHFDHVPLSVNVTNNYVGGETGETEVRHGGETGDSTIAGVVTRYLVAGSRLVRM